jgi:hypothetical protein
MFTEHFEKKRNEIKEHHRKGTLHKVVVPIAAGSAAGLATKRYWLPKLTEAIKGHANFSKLPERKRLPAFRKIVSGQTKGMVALLGSVLGARAAADYLINKLDAKKNK